MSVQNAIVSEYADMVLVETLKTKAKADSTTAQKVRIWFIIWVWECKFIFTMVCSSDTFYACWNFLLQL